MISKPHINDASAAGSNARFSFLGMLLLGIGLLVGLFQPAVAAPGTGAPAPAIGAYTYTIIPYKNDAVAPSGVDIVELDISPIPPLNTEFSASFGGSSGSVGFSDANGHVFFYISNQTAGTVTVTINDANGNPLVTANNPITMTFISAPGPPSSNTSYFVLVQNNAVANGVAQDVALAYIYDQYGNPISGATITWTNNGPASFVGSNVTTTGTGGTSNIGLTSTNYTNPNDVTAIVSYTDPSTGVTTTFPLYTQGSPPASMLVATFIQPTPDPTTSFISAIVTPNPADGTSQDEVQATVYDNTGQPYNGPITFTILNPGTANPTPVTVSTTVVNGVATATYTSNAAGSVEIQASVNGTPLYDQPHVNQYATIVFTIPPPNTTDSYITPLITPMPADGTSQDEVEVYLEGTNGLPIVGATITFSVTSGAGTMVTTTATTNSSGMATANLTDLNVEFDDVTATYTDPSTGTVYTFHDKVNTSQLYAIVQFVAGPVNPAKSYLVVTQDNATADGTSTDIVVAYLYDAEGHPVDASTVTLNWTSVPTLKATTTSGNTITQSFVSLATGPFQVQAQVNGIPGFIPDHTNTANNYVTIHFVVSTPVPGEPGGGGAGGTNPGSGGKPPGSGGSGTGGGSGGGGTDPGSGNNSGPTSNSGFTVLYIQPAYNYRLADGKQQDSVYAYISDAYKHPVPGVQVTFFMQTTPTAGTITSGAQWVGSPVNVTTDANGIARIAMTSTTAGTVFVDATIVDPTTGNTVLIDGSYQVAVFNNKPDVTNIQTALTVIVGEALADGVQQNEVKAHVVDLDGNVMPNQTVMFAIDSGTGTIVTPQPVTTDANGDAFIQITSSVSGYVLITAVIDDSLKIIYGSPARVYFAKINIYVPRVFTPNNDGTNDILKPILVGISNFHYFSVYNRWGNLIFTTQDPNQGWDGTFKGAPQPVETYLWIAEGIDENGKKVVQKGMTSLVR